MTTSIRRISSTVWVLGTIFLAGCRSWQPVALPQSAAPHTLKVTLHDGSVVSVKHARGEGDTLLVGQRPTGESWAVPVSEVAEARAMEFDRAMTFWTAVLSLPLLVFGLMILSYPST